LRVSRSGGVVTVVDVVDLCRVGWLLMRSGGGGLVWFDLV